MKQKVIAQRAKVIAIVIALLLLTTSSSCSKNDVRTMAVTANRTVIVLEAIRASNRGFGDAKIITAQEALVNIGYIREAVTIAEELNNVAVDFNAQLEDIEASLADPITVDKEALKVRQKELLAQVSIKTRTIIDRLLVALDRLNEQGILRIKNVAARDSLSILFKSIRVLL